LTREAGVAWELLLARQEQITAWVAVSRRCRW